ncbi:MAG: MarR family transcriptional regulator [Hyphomicrobiales bacterium]|nr:MAG: MarR family transcriptional regulator [Hyphomicrobiales bacterium]
MPDPQIITEPLEGDDKIDLRMVELFFFAYRDFITDADEILHDYGFGRAHHRVLHFTNRQPGLSVAQLLEILKITKQSLGPILRDLVDAGHLVQQISPSDGRKRLLYPTEKGRNLSVELSERQSLRIRNALMGVEGRRREQVEQFLYGMISADEHKVVSELMVPPDPATE